jgi:hypothetical protein
MVYEENKTWAVPKRPKFVVEDASRSEMEEFIGHLKFSDNSMSPALSRDTYLTFEPIRSFETVDDYFEKEKIFCDNMYRAELELRSKKTFLSGLSGHGQREIEKPSAQTSITNP